MDLYHISIQKATLMFYIVKEHIAKKGNSLSLLQTGVQQIYCLSIYAPQFFVKNRFIMS